MNHRHQQRAKMAQKRSKQDHSQPRKTSTRPIMTKQKKPRRQTTPTPAPTAPKSISMYNVPKFNTLSHHSTHLTPSILPPTFTTARNMWFLPQKSTFKSKIQKTLLNAFNLVPPPPSVNLEEFALMSKMFQVIIDTRTEELRDEGKIPKSIHIPLSTMTDENRDNIGIQFANLTVLVYDQNGTTVDEAAAYLRDCGAEAWALEGGADAFKKFVDEAREGSYTRRVTLEEAQQHVYAQAMAGGRIPRKYDPNRVIEQFESDSSEDENLGENRSFQVSSTQQGSHGPQSDSNRGAAGSGGFGQVERHTVSINPALYRQEEDQDRNSTVVANSTQETVEDSSGHGEAAGDQGKKAVNPFAKAKVRQEVVETKQQQVNV